MPAVGRGGGPGKTVGALRTLRAGERRRRKRLAVSEQGVLLATLLPVSALALTPGRKNDQAALAVTATGADGYAATVSYGEIAPDLGNRGILISTAEDGQPLPQPRLVVPGDVKGARYVSELVDLRVGRVS